MPEHSGKVLPESVEELKARLLEAEETLRAIREGEVDALVISGAGGEQVYSLVGAESVYRLIVDTMREAAFTIAFDGTILYSNRRFGEFVKRPMEQVVGHPLHEFVTGCDRAALEDLLIRTRQQPLKQRLVFAASDGTPVPAHVSSTILDLPEGPSICVVATDLTELENSTELIARLRQQQDALRESEERLRQANEDLALRVAEVQAARAATEETNRTLLREVAERQRAEEALRQSEEQNRLLADLLERSDLPFGVGYPDGRLGPVNEAFERLTGYSREELSAMDWAQVLTPPEWREIERTKLEDLHRTGQPVRYEKEYIRKDGSRVPIDLLVHLSKNEEGQPAFYYSFLTDLTERRRSENALRESEGQFRTLANAIPQLSWMAGADGWRYWYNERWYEYTGTTPPQMEGWGWQSVHDPEALPEVMERWKDSIATGKPFGMVFPLRGADGVFRPFLTRGMPVHDQAGRVTGWVGTNTDITEQQKTERELERRVKERTAELARSVALLETVTSNAPIILAAVDAHGVFTLHTGKAIPVTGHKAGAVIGKNYKDVDFHFPESRENFRRALNGEDFTAIVRGGTDTVFEARYTPLRDVDGNITGMIALSVDITERIRAEEAIRKLNESLEERVRERTAELEAANRELHAFTYSVSHDLRAPLRHIAGFSGLLEEEYGKALPDQARHYIDVIRNGTRRMGQMVDELLTLSRVGRQDLRIQMTGLNSLIEEVRNDLQSEIAGRTIDWKIGTLPFVECDSGLVKQVLANLLSNAVKFTRLRQNAVIEVGSTVASGSPVIYVRDNGVGFSMKYAGKLFGVFQRLHRAEDFEGTGVGLATVQRIVNKHGGRVWVEAELNQGATFFFTLGPLGSASALPLADASMGATKGASEAESQWRGAA